MPVLSMVDEGLTQSYYLIMQFSLLFASVQVIYSLVSSVLFLVCLGLPKGDSVLCNLCSAKRQSSQQLKCTGTARKCLHCQPLHISHSLCSFIPAASSIHCQSFNDLSRNFQGLKRIINEFLLFFKLYWNTVEKWCNYLWEKSLFFLSAANAKQVNEL